MRIKYYTVTLKTNLCSIIPWITDATVNTSPQVTSATILLCILWISSNPESEISETKRILHSTSKNDDVSRRKRLLIAQNRWNYPHPDIIVLIWIVILLVFNASGLRRLHWDTFSNRGTPIIPQKRRCHFGIWSVCSSKLQAIIENAPGFTAHPVSTITEEHIPNVSGFLTIPALPHSVSSSYSLCVYSNVRWVGLKWVGFGVGPLLGTKVGEEKWVVWKTNPICS